ncbi:MULTISPECIES: membrane protein [Streptomyces]|uniref:Integral membrane protein n=1 Tax=Streptomyces flaveolus TaxID=67297 RepID=A0ABV3A4M8_9ACTN|nr:MULTISPECIES: membrane protein [Streptomyces]KMS93155.1 membrane protein [Streptomyces regensis]KOG74240.1 membrane protein [Streptomyces antibioticus]
MAVQEARGHTDADGVHEGGCACGDCPHGAREGHRRAVAAFLRRRDEFAAGRGLPAAVAHSASASRQWVSEELTQRAEAVAEQSRAEGAVRLARLWLRTVYAVWGAVTALLLVEALTAIGAGWTGARTAALLAALAVAAALTAACFFHRARGGALAPVIGEDNRVSTSRAVAACWVLFVAYAVLLLAARLAAASDHAERDALLSGLDLARGAGVVTVLAVVCGVAVLVRRVVGVRILAQRLQKIPAHRPRAADLLTDDSGRGAFTDIQYVVISAVALLFAAVRLARRPDQLPDLPWGLGVIVLISAATYLAGKYAEGGRPVILSVVRAREPGDLDGPIRTGDDIEIRGSGFVPPGAQSADRLSRMVVRIGAVDVHVPLVPVTGGFRNPTDNALTVPVPAEVEPGAVEVQVVTAAGVATNRCVVQVTE